MTPCPTTTHRTSSTGRRTSRTLRREIALLPLFVWLASSALIAQTTQPPFSNGPLLDLPSMFSIDESTTHGTSGERGAENWHKKVGASDSGPTPLAYPGAPDFSVKALFRSCRGTAISKGPLPDVDAQSLGLDILPIDRKGKLAPSPMSWSGLVLSVKRGTKGKGRLADELKRPGGNSADFFHHIYRGSTCIPPEFVGVTLKGQDSTEIRLPSGAEIDALDVYASLYARDAAPLLGLPGKPTLWFSFGGTSSNLALVPKAWWGATKPSGAAVFKSTWDGSRWSCPVVAFAPSELGLCDEEDVDAFAYDRTRGVVFFSTTLRAATSKCPARDALMWIKPGLDFAAAAAVEYADGSKVSVEIGIIDPRIDDLDAICGLDPVCQNRGTIPGIPIELALGQAMLVPPFSLPRLQAQAWRCGCAKRYDLSMYGGIPGGFAIWFIAPARTFNPIIPMEALIVPQRSKFLGNPVGPRQLVFPPNFGPWDIALTWISFAPRPPYRLHMSIPLRLRGR